MATSAVVGAIVIAAVLAGASAYMASENAAAQARAQRKMSEWQQEAEEKQAQAARKQVRLKAERMLNAQAAKAGGAGVVAGEGSLLENQLEAASLAQYEEDLAAYSHDISAQGHGYQAKLFKWQQGRIESQKWLNVGLSAASSAASTYAGSYGKTGKTVSTGGSWSYTDDLDLYSESR